MELNHLLVDFDGVIRHWPNDYTAIESKFGLPENAIAKEAFSKDLLTPAIRGDVLDRDWRQNIASNLARKNPESQAIEAVDEWSAYMGVIDNDVLELLEKIPDIGISLVTNATSRLVSDLKYHGIVDRFDHIFNSSDIGAIKPEEQLYIALSFIT